MKRVAYKIILLLIFPLISMVGFSSWIISTSKEEVVNVEKLVKVRDVAYIGSNPNVKYTSIEKALQVAKSGDVVHVILNKDTTNPTIIKNNCVIKPGVTLNIPKVEGEIISKNSEGNMEATSTSGTIDKNPETKAVNIVKVKDNVELINYGHIIIGGTLSGGSGGTDYAGHTVGDHARIIMGSNSKITSYGNIWNCGYIIEETKNNGSLVDVKSGTLGLPFVVRDTRGGTHTYAIYQSLDRYSCNLFNQFELINITSKIKVNSNGSLEGYANLYILDNNDATVGLVGNSSNDFMQLSSGSYLELKYDKDTFVAQYDFYGGLSFNELVMNLKMKIIVEIPITLETSKVFFPLSWRMNVTLNPLQNQNEIALVKSTNQRFKLMPGHKLIINKGCKFISPDVNVYTYYNDINNPIAGKEYPILDPAEFIVNGQFECTGSFGGRLIYGNDVNVSTDIKISGSQELTTYEPYSTKASISLGDKEIHVVDEMLVINEKMQLVSYSNFMNKKFLNIGVKRTTNGSTPTYSYSVNGTDNSNVLSGNIVKDYLSGTVIKPNLKTNITTARWNNEYYVKNEEKILDKTSLLEIESSASNIGSIDMGTVSISGGTEIKVNDTITLTATNSNANSYTKTYIWESSNPEIASIDENGNLKAHKEGTTNIYAYSADADRVHNEHPYVVTVVDSEKLISIDTMRLETKDGNSTGAGAAKTFNVELIISNIYAASLDKYTIKWSCSCGSDHITEASDNMSASINIPANNSTSSNVTHTIKVQATPEANSGLTTPTPATMDFIATKAESSGGCLLPDTLVTMADGSKVEARYINPGDMLKIFNHETGEYDEAPVLFNDYEEIAEVSVINLEFSNGSYVGVVSEHGFFDLNLMKYIYIDEFNYDNYVNHRFYADNGEIVTLEKAYLTREYTEVYSPVTKYHMNYFTEDILSMPGGIEGLFNIFEYDDDLKFNQELMNKDIEIYGLFTYDDFKDLVPYELYDSFATKYFKVAIGKGILTWDQLYYYIERYGPLVV